MGEPMLMLLALAVADPLSALRAQDEAVARVGYQLASAGAAFCRGDGHPAGLVVERLSQYPPAERPAAIASGLGTLPTITVVVPGAPAATSGLHVGDQLAAIEGERIAAEDPARAASGYDAVAAVRSLLGKAMADGTARLDVVSNGQSRALSVVAPAGCNGQFYVRPGNRLGGSSDGDIIQITAGLVDFIRSDTELAAVIAHELSHNILRHPQRLEAIGRPRRAVRDTEIAADRLSVYLLDAAGYPFDEALAARERIGRKTSWGILGDGTHPGWRQTIALMQAEHARIVALRAASQPVRPPAELEAAASPP